MKYKVNLEKTEEGYAFWCPGLPGCWSQGATEEEALENIKDAVEMYLATIEELKITRLRRYSLVKHRLALGRFRENVLVLWNGFKSAAGRFRQTILC